ncbi:MAG: NINE protein [Alphaproteobacteria bacterium]|nr:NINE protein [Alphaproteobacteria bacterium]
MLDAEKLKQLKEEGHITEEEYLDEKKRLAANILKRNNPAHAKNGIIYIVLAWFLGTLGLHNFYAGYWGRALVQLTMTIVAPWFLYIPLLIVGIWIFGELLFVNNGPHKVPFKGNRKIIMLLRIIAVVVFILLFANTRLIIDEYNISSPEMPSATETDIIFKQ